MSRHRKAHSNYEGLEGDFMQDLQESLLQAHDQYGINAFQTIFNKKKMINQMISKQKQMKQQAHNAYIKAKQRVAQIQQLQMKVDKQTSLLKSQVEKINDAHNIAKILMMQKIVKLQRQAESIEKKRANCHQIKMQTQRSSLAHMGRSINKIQKAKLDSLSRTIALQKQKNMHNYYTLQANRDKAELVRMDRERRQARLRRIQQYKIERAQKNYTQKLINMQKSIQQKGTELSKLIQKQKQNQQHLQATENVTQDYLNSFFATSSAK